MYCVYQLSRIILLFGRRIEQKKYHALAFKVNDLDYKPRALLGEFKK